MPLYNFKCIDCKFEFEVLSSYEKRDEEQKCPECGKEAKRLEVNSFAFSTTLDPKRDTIYSPKEIDMVVGKDSEKKWQITTDKLAERSAARRKARWGDKKLKEIDIPRDPDGKTTPIMHLGDPKEKNFRKEYVEALQTHRAEREKKGLSQLEGPGAIDLD